MEDMDMTGWLFIDIDHSESKVRVVDKETENSVTGYGPCRGQAQYVNEQAHIYAEKHGYEVIKF